MNTDAYKYDVAFSFLADDEKLAREMNDRMPSASRFLYADRQGDLVGGDGEVLLNKAFGSESRIVVVLYRDGWGQTPWIRVEETAIRNRGFDHR